MSFPSLLIAFYRHKSSDHYDVCRSAKWMMLHVRDCPGTTSTFDVCPFPWCRKTKHLLYHLVSCESPGSCAICSPVNLNVNMKSLRGLNDFRLKKQRQCVLIANQQPPSSKGKTSATRDGHQSPQKTQSNANESTITARDEINTYGGTLDSSVDARNGAKEPMAISSDSGIALAEKLLEEQGNLNTSSRIIDTIDPHESTHDVKSQLDDFVDEWETNDESDLLGQNPAALKDDPDVSCNGKSNSPGELTLNCGSVMVKQEDDEQQ